MNDLATIARELRAKADANIHERGTKPTGHNSMLVKPLDINGTICSVSLDRIQLDDWLSTYVLIIGGFKPPTRPSDDACQAIARAIWDVEWQEPQTPFQPLNMRWFIRARVDKKNCPKCDWPNERGDDDGPTMACAHCGHEFEL